MEENDNSYHKWLYNYDANGNYEGETYVQRAMVMAGEGNARGTDAIWEWSGDNQPETNCMMDDAFRLEKMVILELI